LLISCSIETQIQRLLKRDSYTRAQATRIIESQMSLEQKTKLCTWVIENEGVPEALYNQLQKWEGSL